MRVIALKQCVSATIETKEPYVFRCFFRVININKNRLAFCYVLLVYVHDSSVIESGLSCSRFHISNRSSG